jgi:hypothetical protein
MAQADGKQQGGRLLLAWIDHGRVVCSNQYLAGEYLAFVNMGSIRAGLPAGPVRIDDVNKLVPCAHLPHLH